MTTVRTRQSGGSPVGLGPRWLAALERGHPRQTVGQRSG